MKQDKEGQGPESDDRTVKTEIEFCMGEPRLKIKKNPMGLFSLRCQLLRNYDSCMPRWFEPCIGSVKVISERYFTWNLVRFFATWLWAMEKRKRESRTCFIDIQIAGPDGPCNFSSSWKETLGGFNLYYALSIRSGKLWPDVVTTRKPRFASGRFVKDATRAKELLNSNVG